MSRKSLTKITLVLTLLIALFIAAGSTVSHADGDSSSLSLLHLNFNGLEDLGPGWVYEGWLIVDGQPVSSGRFTVDSAGQPSETRFPVYVAKKDAAAFVLTIEPEPDPDPGPSDTHLLGGDFHGKRARLRTAHPAALGDNFRKAKGSYILNAPSGSSLGTPYTHGIWWLDPAAGPGPTLNLPALPAGWVYEGWVVGADGPISTGTFTAVDMADSDGAGATGGPDASPPFPGQDFVNPPTDLTRGYAAVISIEPYPDNSPAPFTLKPLVDSNIDDTGAPGILQKMANNARSFPTGVAQLHKIEHYQVTLENTTSGQPFSPPVAVTHARSALMPLFGNGFFAPPAIEAIAEDGNQSLLVELLEQSRKVNHVVDVGLPLTPQGTAVGDFSDSVTFDIYARPGDRISLAGMLICTNDGLVGLNSAKLPRHGSAHYMLNGYDAGTENNTERSEDIVDACSALGPVVLDGDANGNVNDAVDTWPREKVTLHPGITGVGDLLPAHDWDGPVAKLTITRISDAD
jgi:hypothetical protein